MNWIIPAFIMSIMVLMIAGAVSGTTISDESEAAKALLLEGNYSSALAQYRLLTHQYPNETALWNNQGVTQLRLDQCADAQVSFQRVLELDPGQTSGYINSAKAFICQGNTTAAATMYDQAVLRAPGDEILLKEVGAFYRNLNPERSLQAYKTAAMLNESDTSTLFDVGEILFQLSRFEEAIEIYSQIVHLSPDEELAWYNLGVNYEAVNRFSDALDAYDHTIQLNSSNYKAWSNKGIIYYDHNRYNESLSAMNRVVILNPGLSDAWFIRAISQKNLGDVNGSIDSFERASALAPNDSVKKAYFQKYRSLADEQTGGEGSQHTPMSMFVIIVGLLSGVIPIIVCRK